jgi:serine/threonine protein kinase/predicted Zn-dependent protease
MSPSSTLGRTWDEAGSPAATRLARKFEADWNAAPSGQKPEPLHYLPDQPDLHSSTLLALLQAEMNLRWGENDPVPLESYLVRYPKLDPAVAVALLYEEYCLRQEVGPPPDPAEFERRFPDLAAPLRRLLAIHDLMEHSGQSTVSHSLDRHQSTIRFPTAGQTISDFKLVEELGRGAFARVFRAQERQLADRPVALKVARAGSREPQTLARLQHTHIVPVHSYRIDPATNLHLLCMPYFGRLTLAAVLADPAFADARSGEDLLAILEQHRDDGSIPGQSPPKHATAAQEALRSRSLPAAIAWWGARLAEALQHAHDRNVLHRDVKPSNVLVTAEGMPMLLDFNLARLVREEVELEHSKLGGTLDYMAPEHLEALAEGRDENLDERADLYSLGVVLFEALTSQRPFPRPKPARSVAETLHQAALQRRVAPPRVLRANAKIPLALEAVVRHCLQPKPEQRYQTAADLAADLQAAADDEPLLHAAEPTLSVARRWIKRNSRRAALAAPLVIAALALGIWQNQSRIARETAGFTIRQFIDEARIAEANANFSYARDLYHIAETLAAEHPQFALLQQQAHEKYKLADEAWKWRERADQLFQDAEELRFRLLGFTSDPDSAFPRIEETLQPFYVLSNPDWARAAHINLLDPAQQARLPTEVNELLFLWLLAMEQAHAGDQPRILRCQQIAQRVLSSIPQGSPLRGPWEALITHLAGREPTSQVSTKDFEARGHDDSHSDETLAAFLWGVLHRYERRPARSVEWLDLAARNDPANYWARFYLASSLYELGQPDAALRHADVAVALRPHTPWAWFNRAEIQRARGSWDRALADLLEAQRRLNPNDSEELGARIQLNSALVLQALGDFPTARAYYQNVIASSTIPEIRRAARLDLANLESDLGHLDQALKLYEALANDEPHALDVQQAHATTLLHLNRPQEALQILENAPQPAPEWVALHILTLLKMGQAAIAEPLARSLLDQDPSPEYRRLALRTQIAARHVQDLDLLDPDELDLLPSPREALNRELQAALDLLSKPAQNLPTHQQRTRATLLHALDHPDADAQALLAWNLDQQSTESTLVLARGRLRNREPLGALEILDLALNAGNTDHRLLPLRARALVLVERADEALATLHKLPPEAASSPDATLARAEALHALQRYAEALPLRTRLLERDPTNPRLHIDRARTLHALQQIEPALADLENAAAWAVDRPRWLAPVAVDYALLLPAKPNRWPRVLNLGRQALAAAPPTL